MSTDKNRDFIREAIDADLENGRYDRVITRFPPEPNAHLHIGHAKAICVNFGIAASYRWPVQSPLRRHQPHPRRARIRGLHAGGHSLARLRLGAAAVLRFRLFRPALRMGRRAHQKGLGVRG